MKLPSNTIVSYHEAIVTLALGKAAEIDIGQQQFAADTRKVVIHTQDGEHVIEHDGSQWVYRRCAPPSRVPRILKEVGFWLIALYALIQFIRSLT
jgi:hypothetical protein